MLLAAIYNTPAVPNQNMVSNGFIVCMLIVFIIY
jgi:hypothetical protein